MSTHWMQTRDGSWLHTDDPVTHVTNTNEPRRRDTIAGSEVLPFLRNDFQPMFYPPAGGGSAINGTWGNASRDAERLVRLSIEEEEEQVAARFRNMPGFGMQPVRTPNLSPVVLIERMRPSSADGVRAFHYIDRQVHAIDIGGEPEPCLPHFLAQYQRYVVCTLKLCWTVIMDLWGNFFTREQVQAIRWDMDRIAFKIFQHTARLRDLDASPAFRTRTRLKYQKMMRRLVFPMLMIPGGLDAYFKAFYTEYEKQIKEAGRLDLVAPSKTGLWVLMNQGP